MFVSCRRLWSKTWKVTATEHRIRISMDLWRDEKLDSRHLNLLKLKCFSLNYTTKIQYTLIWCCFWVRCCPCCSSRKEGEVEMLLNAGYRNEWKIIVLILFRSFFFYCRKLFEEKNILWSGDDISSKLLSNAVNFFGFLC